MRYLLLGFFLATVACGGEAVIAPPSGSGGNSSTTSTTVGSTTTGGGCQMGDCPPNSVCVDGTCRATCDLFNPCPVGEVCDECATSSCPGCLDCVAACLPGEPGTCDDHDDCNAGELCVYSQQICAPTCDANGACADPNTVCVDCATSSCPGCEDCAAVCLEI
jgi:hypothetical protein